MRTSRINRLLFAGLVVAAMTGCASSKKMTYLLDMEYNHQYDAIPAPAIVIQPGDRLGVVVSSSDARLSAPFYAAPIASETASAPNSISYVVGNDGCIDFAYVGSIHVDGMTLTEARDEIAKRISARGLIKEPEVNVVLENFTVTVMGSVTNNVLPVDGSGINLLQAIARSGGTTSLSKIQEVTVIRTEKGIRTAYSVDLQKKDLFESPVFFLRQNDIVYVKPKGSSLSPEGQAVMTIVGSALTLGSIITNFLLWSGRYHNSSN